MLAVDVDPATLFLLRRWNSCERGDHVAYAIIDQDIKAWLILVQQTGDPIWFILLGSADYYWQLQ